MILFASPGFERAAALLKERAPNLRPGAFRVERFSNGELVVRLQTPVSGESCAILASISPPEEHLASTLLAAHTLQKEGASEIIAALPYLAYSRQDKDKPGESLAIRWIGALMRASGVTRVVTVDIHSARDAHLFAIPLLSVSPATVFAETLRQYEPGGATIVAPDEGAIPRCEALIEAAGLAPVAIPYFEKHRDEGGIHHARFVGQAGANVVLVDDILDTGATLISACRRLLSDGVRNIQIMITHGLFTGKEWTALWDLGVSRIFATDTVPLPAELHDSRIVRVPAYQLLCQELAG
jgi:ribose-phosphate pyrophosphokinase